jgi:hypothetical protein
MPEKDIPWLTSAQDDGWKIARQIKFGTVYSQPRSSQMGDCKNWREVKLVS